MFIMKAMTTNSKIRDGERNVTKRNFFKKLALALSFSVLAPLATTAKIANATTTDPVIQAQSAIVVDYETGEVIYAKGATDKRYPASTTKLMTALLLAEHKSKSDSLIYTKTAKEQPPYSINTNYKPIAVDSKINADTVMQALLLYSGNDMAYCIADNIGGNTEGFAKMMNEKAKELGMKDTTFTTPNGLDDDALLNGGTHITTAYDLAILTKAAFENDWIRETLQLKDTHISLPDGTVLKLDNRNKGLGTEGNIGGKTGYTSKAVGCFAGVYEKEGKKYIGVVLKTSRINDEDMSMFNDTNAIVNAAVQTQPSTFKKANEEIGNVDLEYKLFKFFGPTKTISVPVKLAEDVTYYKNSFNDSNSNIEFNVASTDAWSVAFNSDVTLKYTSGDFTKDVKGTIELSAFDILKANMGFYLISLVVIILVVVLVIFAVKVIGNGNRRGRRRF